LHLPNLNGTAVTSCHIQSGPFPLAANFDDWLFNHLLPGHGVYLATDTQGHGFRGSLRDPLDEYDVARVGARYYQVTDTLLTQELISI
jgi:hypothetical protein